MNKIDKNKIIQNIIKYKGLVSLIVTILLATILYLGYTSFINSQIEPVEMPVANSYLKSGQMINENDINYVAVPKHIVIDDVYNDSNELIGKYVNSYNAVAEGSLFYKELLTTSDDIKDANSFNLSEGEVAISIDADIKSSYANSILKGHVIDVYYQGYATVNDENDKKVLYGLLVKNARVIAVRDQEGISIDQNNGNDTAVIVLALNYDDGDLVQRAKFFGDVIPIVSYDALHQNQTSDYYDVAKMKDIIYQRTIDVKLLHGDNYE